MKGMGMHGWRGVGREAAVGGGGGGGNGKASF